MKPVAEADAVLDAMGRIGRGCPEFSVSFFASTSKIEAWCAEGVLATLEYEGAVLVLRHDGLLLRVGHVTNAQAALSMALRQLVEVMPGQLMVADLVGRPDEIAWVADTYRQHGFASHAQLLRMQRMGAQPAATADAADVELAGREDVPKLRAFMERWLDPLSEQIQSVEELRVAVAENAAHVVRDGEGLAGFLISETTGQSTVLRYWHVAGDRRGQGIGSRLMRTFFNCCAASRRVTLWVIAGNVDAIAKYRHYGFSEDGMVDNVMVRQLEAAR